LKLFDRQTKAVIERLGFSGGATDLFDRFVSLPCCGERATLGARGPAAVRRGSGFLRPLSVYSVVWGTFNQSAWGAAVPSFWLGWNAFQRGRRSGGLARRRTTLMRRRCGTPLRDGSLTSAGIRAAARSCQRRLQIRARLSARGDAMQVSIGTVALSASSRWSGRAGRNGYVAAANARTNFGRSGRVFC